MAENKAPLPKYTNYHSLNALVDHIYAVTDKNLNKKPEAMKSNRSQRDVKKNYGFHKDIWHNTKRSIVLKDEIESLIRVGTSRSSWMSPKSPTKRSNPDSRV